jgi:AcrR family transcriptional regulator
VAAAREVFATAGYDAPLSAVARQAGVGQGSLYRHFPDRVSLALAVFEDGVAELEALAGQPTSTLDDVLELLTEQAIASTAFVTMVSVPARPDPRLLALRDRVSRQLEGGLERARSEGRVRGDVTADDLVLAVGMIAGVLSKVPAADRVAAARRLWKLLREGIDAR